MITYQILIYKLSESIYFLTHWC